VTAFGKPWTRDDFKNRSPVVRAQAERIFDNDTHSPGKPAPRHAGTRCFSQWPELDGVAFDSGLECRRAETLAALARAGEIADLRFHPRHTLSAAAVPYTADAEYTEAATGRVITEEVKPVRWRRLRIHRRFVDIVRLWSVYGPNRLRVVVPDGRGWIERDVLTGENE